VLAGVVQVCLDAVRLDVDLVELQHLGTLVVDPDHGVERRHAGKSFLEKPVKPVKPG
jgi:hypothetical protein